MLVVGELRFVSAFGKKMKISYKQDEGFPWWLVGWSLTSLFSTDTAISETKRDSHEIGHQWRKPVSFCTVRCYNSVEVCGYYCKTFKGFTFSSLCVEMSGSGIPGYAIETTRCTAKFMHIEK